MKASIRQKLISLLGFALGLYLILVFAQAIIFTNRFGLYSKIAGVDVSLLDKEDAAEQLEKAYSGYSASEFRINEESYLVAELIEEVAVEETVNMALLEEQRGYFLLSKGRVQNYALKLRINDRAVGEILSEKYDEYLIEPKDAVVTINGEVEILPEINGQRLLLPESRQLIIDGLSAMNSAVSLRVVNQIPALTQEQAREALLGAQVAVNEPITVLGDGTTYTIESETLKGWVKITPTSPKTLVAIEQLIPKKTEYFYLDPNKVFLYVDDLAKKIDVEAKNVRLGSTAGKAVVAAPEIIGQKVNRNDAILQIQTAVAGDKVASLKIERVEPQITSANLSELGLVDLISTGWTDFTGSPANRVHNVNTGASKFNGVLIEQGKEISFNNILGPVDASTGYLPELVILADKTVPEFGGGLCQVSSTAFRAALNAGLPILERHAHAYPVSYYKPYGVDATIYLPKPDLRFENDTGEYILIQTRIEGRKLYFDFYGTKKPVTVKFSGNENATNAVDVVEKVSPYIYDQDLKGRGSFTAVFYRHIYDINGKLLDNDKFASKYDSPDNYPH